MRVREARTDGVALFLGFWVFQDFVAEPAGEFWREGAREAGP